MDKIQLDYDLVISTRLDLHRFVELNMIDDMCINIMKSSYKEYIYLTYIKDHKFNIFKDVTNQRFNHVVGHDNLYLGPVSKIRELIDVFYYYLDDILTTSEEI